MAKAGKKKAGKKMENKKQSKKQRKKQRKMKRKMDALRRQQQQQQRQQRQQLLLQQQQQQHQCTQLRNPPSGWTEYSDFGDPIDVLIPIRVPLDSQRYRGSIRSLRELADIQRTQYNRSVGMVIDLTASSKYYGVHCVPEDLTHVKIAVCGSPGQTPYNMVSQFLRTVEQFKAKNPGKFIFVHCTHGINRTGYMVCSYLIRRNGLQASEAISLFQTRRPPGMHNSLFLADLLVRYGDVHCELFKQFLQHNFPKSPQYANSKKVAINLRHTLEILEGASRYQPQKQKESNNDSRDDSSPQAKVSEEFGWRRDQRVVDDTADNSSGCRDTRPMTEDDHSSEWRRDHRMVDDTADNSSGWRRDHQMTDDTTASSEWRDIRCMFTDYGTVDNSSDWRRDQRSHHEVHMQPNRQEHQQREHETRWRTDRDDRAQHWQSDRHSSRSNHSDRHERWK